MYVIEPRQSFDEDNNQLLVKKVYALVPEEGWVLQTEEEIWSPEHKENEEWFEVPETEGE
jgi:hypothetical protein